MERGKTWLTALATGFLAFAVVAAPALSQAPPREPEAGEENVDRKAKKVPPIDLVVDSVAKLTWRPQDLRRLTDASEVKWTPQGRKGRPHPAVSIWDLLKDGGVAKEQVTELRIANQAKTLTFKGEDLVKVDQLVLRTAAKKGALGPWLLAPMDPALGESRGLSLAKIRRLEVITAK